MSHKVPSTSEGQTFPFLIVDDGGYVVAIDTGRTKRSILKERFTQLQGPDIHARSWRRHGKTRGQDWGNMLVDDMASKGQ